MNVNAELSPLRLSVSTSAIKSDDFTFRRRGRPRPLLEEELMWCNNQMCVSLYHRQTVYFRLLYKQCCENTTFLFITSVFVILKKHINLVEVRIFCTDQ